jgi:hypothetical protein
MKAEKLRALKKQMDKAENFGTMFEALQNSVDLTKIKIGFIQKTILINFCIDYIDKNNIEIK